jgi:spermidine synthase
MPFLQSSTCSLLGWIFSLGLLAASDQRVIYETHSHYNHILVLEDEQGLRHLLFSEDGAQQSVRRPGETNALELPYSRTMMVGLACVGEPERILVVGLGGGSIPSFLHARYAQARIDCAEIDPAVIDVAKRYFGFCEDDRLKGHAADGRKFIEQTTNRYDLVFLDAYGDDQIPSSLTTRQFLQSVRRVLQPGGIVLGNVWSRLSNPLYDSMLRTYQEVFEQVYLFHVPARGNVIFLAIPRAGKLALDDLAQQAKAVSHQRNLGFDLEALVRFGYQEAQMRGEARILEDRNMNAREAQDPVLDGALHR